MQMTPNIRQGHGSARRERVPSDFASVRQNEQTEEIKDEDLPLSFGFH